MYHAIFLGYILISISLPTFLPPCPLSPLVVLISWFESIPHIPPLVHPPSPLVKHSLAAVSSVVNKDIVRIPAETSTVNAYVVKYLHVSAKTPAQVTAQE